MSVSRVRAIWVLTALVAVTAVAVDLRWVPAFDLELGLSDLLWFGLLIVGFYLAESSLIRVRLGSDAIGFSLMEFPLVLGLFFCSPQLLVASRVLGGAASFAWRRPRLQKGVFNCALFAAEPPVRWQSGMRWSLDRTH